MSEQCAIYMWDGSGLNVLVPKKRGDGFLRCPLGHHWVDEIGRIEATEAVDVCGLDGYLQLSYGPIWALPERELIVARVMPKLASYYGFTEWRESTSDFWEEATKSRKSGRSR